MDSEQSSTDGLRCAIDRFEAAAARPRPRLTRAPIRRPRYQLVRWQYLRFVVVAAVLLSSLAAVWLILLERSEPVAVRVSERGEPADTISTPTASSPRAHDQEAASADAGHPLTAVETTIFAPQEEPPRAPARTNGSHPGGNETPVSSLLAVAVNGENRQTPEKRQSPIDRSKPRTEPRGWGQSGGDVAPTRAADATTPPALSEPSPIIPYSGVMTDASGVPLVGRVSAIFALYEAPSGGVPVWVAIKTVRTDATGGYVVVLGGTTEFPMNLFATGETRWLGVQPDGEAETSRVRFTGGPETEPARDAPPPSVRPPSTLVRLGGEAGIGEATATGEDTSPIRTTLGEPPPLIPYRGVLTNASGAPLVGFVSTIFALYEASSGGVPVWVDIKTVHAGASGGFVVLLGETTEFPVDLFVTDEARWLGVQPDGEPEQPRVGFTRMPCALEATSAAPGSRRPLSAARLGGEDSAGIEAAGHGQPQRRGSQPSICSQR